jgi:phosphoserine phosphatase
MLEAVGYPVAVNPEPKLAALARRRGWLVERWSRSTGGPKRLLPLPVDVGS